MTKSYSYSGITTTRHYVTSANTCRVKMTFRGVVAHSSGVSYDPIGNVEPGYGVTIYNDGTNALYLGIETSGAIYLIQTAGSGSFAVDLSMEMI
jgi:hypothetical protein